ncbi:MAG: hypothetical protein AB7V08_14925 [Elusimicrobiales bacterium]
MPVELAQYGIGFLALGVLAYVISFLLRRGNGSLVAVVENNTKALEQVVAAVQAMQIALARQEAKLDELLERARRQ